MENEKNDKGGEGKNKQNIWKHEGQNKFVVDRIKDARKVGYKPLYHHVQNKTDNTFRNRKRQDEPLKEDVIHIPPR